MFVSNQTVRSSCTQILLNYESMSLSSMKMRIAVRVGFVSLGIVAAYLCYRYQYLSLGAALGVALVPVALSCIDPLLVLLRRCLEHEQFDPSRYTNTLFYRAEEGSVVDFRKALEKASDDDFFNQNYDRGSLLSSLIVRYINQDEPSEKLRLLIESGKCDLDDPKHSLSGNETLLKHVLYLHKDGTDAKAKRVEEVIYLLLDNGASWKKLDDSTFVSFAFFLFKNHKEHYLNKEAFAQNDPELAHLSSSMLFLNLKILKEGPQNKDFFKYFLGLLQRRKDFNQEIKNSLITCSETSSTAFYEALLFYFDYNALKNEDLSVLFLGNKPEWLVDSILEKIDNFAVVVNISNSLIDLKQFKYSQKLYAKMNQLSKK